MLDRSSPLAGTPWKPGYKMTISGPIQERIRMEHSAGNDMKSFSFGRRLFNNLDGMCLQPCGCLAGELEEVAKASSRVCVIFMPPGSLMKP